MLYRLFFAITIDPPGCGGASFQKREAFRSIALIDPLTLLLTLALVATPTVAVDGEKIELRFGVGLIVSHPLTSRSSEMEHGATKYSRK